MNNGGSLLKLDIETPTIQPQVIFEAFGIEFSSAMLSGFLLTFLLIIFALSIKAFGGIKEKGVPTRVQSVMELIYTGILDLVEQITASREIGRKIMPIILALVIYIMFSNILLVIPGLSSVQVDGESIFSTNTSDLNSTFGVAATVVIWTQFASIQKFNFWNHFNKYIKIKTVYEGFKQGIGQGLLSIIDFFIGLLDIISEFARALSLSLRLFGNMFAGEILTSLLLSAFAIILPVVLLGMSIFTGLLQALVFGALAASYFGAALRDE